MDYRIVDGYTDPPGLTDPFYTEKLIRLPESFLCYLPDKDSPAVGGLPALKSGHITFGSFQLFSKGIAGDCYALGSDLKSIARFPSGHEGKKFL